MNNNYTAVVAQLGERQTEDLKVPCSIHGDGTYKTRCPSGLRGQTQVLMNICSHGFKSHTCQNILNLYYYIKIFFLIFIIYNIS